MPDIYQTFHVGVNILAVRNGEILLGKRRGIFGAGTWGLPGGHLETGETMVAAAARELLEETGLRADRFEFSNLVNGWSRAEHRLQVGFVAHGIAGEPALCEPDRCETWRWFELGALPPDLFPPHAQQVASFVRGTTFADE